MKFSKSPGYLSSCALLAAVFAMPSWSVAQRDNSKDLLTPAISAAEKTTDIVSISMELWGTDTQTQGVFSGNVVVTGTNMKMTCDRLEIIASRIGDKTITVGKLDKFKYLLATGKVHMIQGDREAFCGRAEIYPREDRIVLTEKPMVIDHGSDATYTGDELDIYRGERRVKGKNVSITFPPIKDLGFDKKQAAPGTEAPTRPDAAASASPTPTPVAPKPSTENGK